MNTREHWEAVYRARGAAEVSWYQPVAARSLDLIRRHGSGPGTPIIDVGGGTSVLVDDLLRAGYGAVTVLDVAGTALAAARARLGDAHRRVTWIEADVLQASLPRARFGVWHDRAVFHFLGDGTERKAYAAQLRHALAPGGIAIIATFADDGPERCSGLPVTRYTPDALREALGDAFEIVEVEREVHATPAGAEQAFLYCVFRPRAGGAAQGGAT